MESKTTLERFLRISPYIVFAAGLLISFFAAFIIYRQEQEKERHRFELACKQVSVLIQTRMAKYEQLLQGTAAFFEASKDINRQMWADFVGKLDLEKNFKGVQALGYAQVVFEKEKRKHEEKVKQEGFLDYRIKPDGIRDLYTPIVFIEPFDSRNKKAFGYDMYSEQNRRSAIEQAAKTSKATLTHKIRLVQTKENESRSGLMMIFPVYQKGVNPKTEEERVSALKGFVYTPFFVDKLMAGVLGARFIKVHFKVYDGDKKTDEALLYSTEDSRDEVVMRHESEIDMYGKIWSLDFAAGGEFRNSATVQMPLYMFAGGSILSLLVSLLVAVTLKIEKRATKLAERMTAELIKSESEIHSIFQAMTEGILIINSSGEISDCNLSAQDILRMSKSEIIGPLTNLNRYKIIKEDYSELREEELPFIIALKTGESQRNFTIGLKREDLKTIWLLVNSEPIFGDDFESAVSVVVTLLDITNSRKSKIELERYIKMVNDYVITSTTDLKGKILSASEAFSKISGYSKEELIGKNHNIVRNKDMSKELYKELWTTILDDKIWEGDIKNTAKDGSEYWVHSIISPQKDEDGKTIGFMAVRQDITDKKRVELLSVTDRLTQLFNRLKIDELLDAELKRASRYLNPFSVIMLDLDKFKSVNDTYGHQAGDEVLKELALILKTNVRESDIVGRWGGEEFIIIAPNTNMEDAVELAEKLREKISEFKFSFAGHKTSSFGVAAYRAGDDEKSLIKRADDALYHAKESGRNKVVSS